MGNSPSLSHTQFTEHQTSDSYHDYQNPNTDPLSSSPDSVIDNWELIEVPDDFDFDIVQYPKHQSSILENPNSYSNGFIKKVNDSFLDSSELVEHSERALTSFPRQPDCSKDSIFKGVYDNNTVISKLVDQHCYLSGTEDMIVLYYTSMRGIRKTYEDCCQVRTILKLSGVVVYERDVSMDSTYKKVLQIVFEGKRFSLPKVFIRGKCFGGADEIKQLHEDGALAALLEGFPVKDPVLVCRSCGDARFVVCSSCNGSRKHFQQGKMRMCSNCNEIGLMHCPDCCS